MKNLIRQSHRERRKGLTPNLRKEKSEAIRSRLEALDEFKSAEKILVFLSKDDEVDTHGLVQDALDQARKVFAPRVDGEELLIYPIKSWDDLEQGDFGILEPALHPDSTHPAEMDLILVPGLAFDKKGHRLGYGKGFYDRLLKATKGLKVGLAFDEDLIEELPAEEHDVPLDLIVTDSSLIRP